MSKRMTDERLAEIEVDDGYPMTDLEIELLQALKAKRRHVNALQAKIDMLMLEYCPEEMTEDQIENWGKHQVPASAEQQAELEAALKEQT